MKIHASAYSTAIEIRRAGAAGENTLDTVLITGGTEGLGKAAALLLAGEGFRVFATGRNTERRAALEAAARESGLPIETLAMDVCDDESVDRAVSEIESRAGRVDAVVNNAGIAIVATMEEISMEDLRRQFETNYFGTVRVTQRVLPGMRERRHGRIVNMSSVAGLLANPLFGPYSATKFAVEAFSDTLRLELYPFGVYVSMLEPGYIPSGMETASLGLSSRYTHGSIAGPYAQLYRNFLENWKKVTRRAKLTPKDCARVVLRALRETPPKARYPVTREASVVRLMKRLLPDRMLDRMIIGMLQLDKIRPGSKIDPAAAKAALEELTNRNRS
ncbi:MAG: SDR family oxidoreductase [Candidatus Acidiferrales bacterium]